MRFISRSFFITTALLSWRTSAFVAVSARELNSYDQQDIPSSSEPLAHINHNDTEKDLVLYSTGTSTNGRLDLGIQTRSLYYGTPRAADNNWIGIFERGKGPNSSGQMGNAANVGWVFAPGREGSLKPEDLREASFRYGSEYTAYFLAKQGYEWLAPPLDFTMPYLAFLQVCEARGGPFRGIGGGPIIPALCYLGPPDFVGTVEFWRKGNGNPQFCKAKIKGASDRTGLQSFSYECYFNRHLGPTMRATVKDAGGKQVSDVIEFDGSICRLGNGGIRC